MNCGPEKFVRLEDWNSKKSDAPFLMIKTALYMTVKRRISTYATALRKGLQHSFEWIKTTGKPYISFSSNDEDDDNPSSEKKILDPQGPFLQRWNKIFVIACVIAVSADPLFFYVPVVSKENCLNLDIKLEKTANALRSFVDIFYLLRIVFQFRTGFISPSSRVFGRGVLVEDSWAIAKKYFYSYFFVDIVAVLPLPQVVTLIIIPRLRGSRISQTKDLLKFIVIFQYVPRIIRIYPLYKQVTRTSGILTETAWAGAAFNLFLYMLASHVLGGFWYLFSIERETVCWRQACGRNSTCQDYLNCDLMNGGNAFLSISCPVREENKTAFDFGIFFDGLQSGIVESTDFPQKVFFCFWWGLRNLSSLGQNLKTSTYIWEVCFAVFISIFGLVLFSSLIGNMQTYLQSTTIRLEEMRVKRRDAEEWMSHRLLPDHLKERIRSYEQYKWQETRGVDEQNLVHSLPKDIRRDIKRHLCLDLLSQVPMFEKINDQLMDAMCDRLKPVLYTQQSYIVREGDPVEEMVFLMRGKLLTETTNGGRTGFFSSIYLKPGDFCGEELVTWALDPQTSSNLPISARTVKALTEVEAFALFAEDLKFLAPHFRRLHSRQIRHTFRFYSQQWRNWAAYFIQSAWRHHWNNKLQVCLSKEEQRFKDTLAETRGSSTQAFGATIYASRFAATALRNIRLNGGRIGGRLVGERLATLMLQKPDEPDFSDEDDK